MCCVTHTKNNLIYLECDFYPCGEHVSNSAQYILRPDAANQFLAEDEAMPPVKLQPRRTNKFASYVGTTVTA